MCPSLWTPGSFMEFVVGLPADPLRSISTTPIHQCSRIHSPPPGSGHQFEFGAFTNMRGNPAAMALYNSELSDTQFNTAMQALQTEYGITV